MLFCNKNVDKNHSGQNGIEFDFGISVSCQKAAFVANFQQFVDCLEAILFYRYGKLEHVANNRNRSKIHKKHSVHRREDEQDDWEGRFACYSGSELNAEWDGMFIYFDRDDENLTGVLNAIRPY